MASASFYVTALRIGNLTSDEACAAGITLSAVERPVFDRDPIAFYLLGAGPTRRKQIEALVTTGSIELRDAA